MSGPTPKRAEERRRRNAVPGETVVPMEGDVVVPELPARGIHAVARAWYQSLAESGQSRYFEPSDWAQAVVVAMLMSRILRGVPRAALVGEVFRGMDALMTTETSRRRARLQVERAMNEAAAEAPTILEHYRKGLA